MVRSRQRQRREDTMGWLLGGPLTTGLEDEDFEPWRSFFVWCIVCVCMCAQCLSRQVPPRRCRRCLWTCQPVAWTWTGMLHPVWLPMACLPDWLEPPTLDACPVSSLPGLGRPTDICLSCCFSFPLLPSSHTFPSPGISRPRRPLSHRLFFPCFQTSARL